MRIVAGAFRGRRILPPRDGKIRPTTDRVREAIFSILAPWISEETHVLDLFAGTGALGLEALSRGALRAVFVDQTAEAVRLIRANVALCSAQDRAAVIQGPVEPVLKRLASQGGAFDLIFMDPPYGKDLIGRTLPHLGAVARSPALVVAEHHVKDLSPAEAGGWTKTQERKYGDTKVSFYTNDTTR